MGARVRACDEKPAAALAGVLAGLPQLEQLSGFTAAAFEGVELVVLSPGVPLVHPLLQDAFARGVELIGEVELAARLLPETEPPPVPVQLVVPSARHLSAKARGFVDHAARQLATLTVIRPGW